MIKAAIFDYGNVIEISEEKTMPGILKILKVNQEQWNAIYHKHNHLTNIEGLDWKDVAVLVAQKLGATNEQLREMSDWIDSNSNKKKLNTELLDIVRELRTLGLQTAIISNYTSSLREKIHTQGIADLFDEIIISGEEKYQKPDPRLFEIAFKKLNVRAEEVVFIDDTPKSLETSKEVGYVPVLYTDNLSLKKSLREILDSNEIRIDKYRK